MAADSNRSASPVSGEIETVQPVQALPNLANRSNLNGTSSLPAPCGTIHAFRTRTAPHTADLFLLRAPNGMRWDYVKQHTPRSAEKVPRAGAVGPAAARPDRQHPRDRVRLTIAPPHVQHRSHQVPHHVVQKTISADTVHQQPSLVDPPFLPCGTKYSPDRRRRHSRLRPGGRSRPRGRIGIGGRKTEEIVRAHKMRGGLIQAGPGPAATDRRIHTAPGNGGQSVSPPGGLLQEDAVLIGLGHRRVPRVKAFRHLFRAQNADRRRQRPVQALAAGCRPEWAPPAGSWPPAPGRARRHPSALSPAAADLPPSPAPAPTLSSPGWSAARAGSASRE